MHSTLLIRYNATTGETDCSQKDYAFLYEMSPQQQVKALQKQGVDMDKLVSAWKRAKKEGKT